MPRQLRLLVSVFVSGAVVMSLELLGSRLLAPVFGNSIFVWGSLIGVALSALSVGYYLGGKIADVKPSFHVLCLLIFGAGLLVLALPAIAPPLFNFVVELGLTDEYAPVENLISPINEQPLTTNEQPFMSQSEAFRVAVGASVVVVVCIILARKRLL